MSETIERIDWYKLTFDETKEKLTELTRELIREQGSGAEAKEISESIELDYGYPCLPTIAIDRKNDQTQFMGMAYYDGTLEGKWGEVITF